MDYPPIEVSGIIRPLQVLFNDIGVYPGVRAWIHHDDHFHVEVKAGAK
jgi:hypothetical protein